MILRTNPRRRTIPVAAAEGCVRGRSPRETVPSPVCFTLRCGSTTAAQPNAAFGSCYRARRSLAKARQLLRQLRRITLPVAADEQREAASGICLKKRDCPVRFKTVFTGLRRSRNPRQKKRPEPVGASDVRRCGLLFSRFAAAVRSGEADQWNCSSSVEPVSAVTEDEPP